MRFLKHIEMIFMTVAAGIIASCTAVDVRPAGRDVPITYQAVVGSLDTRLITGNRYESTAPSFGSSAFILEDGKSWGSDRIAAEVYIPKQEISFRGASWTTASPYNWPVTGKLTFFSFSPWEDVNPVTTIDRTDGVTIRDWNVNGTDGANQRHDIMVAAIAADKTGNTRHDTPENSYNGVETVFHHKLAMIDGFSFRHDGQTYVQNPGQTTEGDMKFHIKKVTINNVAVNGTYKSGNMISNSGTDFGRWIPATAPETDDYVWYELADGGTPVMLDEVEHEIIGGGGTGVFPTLPGNNYLLVIPQTFSDPANALPHENESYLEISYAVRMYTVTDNPDVYFEETVTRYIPLYDLHDGNRWDMNKRYRYSITVSLDRIRCVPEVTEWEETPPVAAQ